MIQEDTMTRAEIGRFVGSVLMDIVAGRVNGMFMSQAICAVGTELLDAVDDLEADDPDDTPGPMPVVSFVWVGRREPEFGDYLTLPADDGGFFQVQAGDILQADKQDIYTRIERQATPE